MTDFILTLAARLQELQKNLTAENGEWAVKGFIDLYQRIYPMTTDTKVISKIIELMLFPTLEQMAHQQNCEIFLAAQQNHYPDLTIREKSTGELIALDLKSTYRKTQAAANGLTLGTYTGYFRRREARTNITFPYREYSAHFVLGVLYTRSSSPEDERAHFSLNELPDMASVAKDFELFLHEKWKIASDLSGSGNTKNIGSIKNINRLIQGQGPFSLLGQETFDDYWMNYLNKEMARAIDSPRPYANLEEYVAWSRGRLTVPPAQVAQALQIAKAEQALPQDQDAEEA